MPPELEGALAPASQAEGQVSSPERAPWSHSRVPPNDERQESQVCEGQLSFGPQQGILSEAPRDPEQLALLPPPPPWDEDPGPPPAAWKPRKKGRMAKKRARTGTSAGQTALF